MQALGMIICHNRHMMSSHGTPSLEELMFERPGASMGPCIYIHLGSATFCLSVQCMCLISSCYVHLSSYPHNIPCTAHILCTTHKTLQLHDQAHSRAANNDS